MPTFSKVIFSASTNGRPVELTASGTPGDLVHSGVDGAAMIDEVWLYGQNHTAGQRDVTIEFGGTAAGDQIEVGVPPQQGLVLLTPGLPISGGALIRAFVDQVSGVSIFGFVNRIDGS